MHRLTALILALLVLFASVLPSALARETNADRLRRGYPPLPPARRATAKRQQTSPIIGTSVIQVRDNTGANVIGYMANSLAHTFVTTVIGPTEPTAERLQAQWSSTSGTLVATDVLTHPFNPPFYLGCPPNLLLQDPYFAPLTVNQNSDGVQWSYNVQTQELTVQVSTNSDSSRGLFVWNKGVNELEMTRNAVSGTVQVRLYLVLAT